MSKPNRLAAGFALAALIALAACSGGDVASVNGQKISRKQLDQKLANSPSAKQVLVQIAQADLIEQYARDHHIDVNSSEIDQQENKIKKQIPRPWDEFLKSQGLTEDDARALLRQQLVVQKAIGSNVHVSESDVKTIFGRNRAQLDQVRARHILVSDAATAKQIEAKLKSGGNFEDLAKQYSKDPVSKDRGGELGFFRRGQMAPSFEAVAFSLPVGKVSAPVKSPYGYHIIQVEEKKAGSMDQVREQLRQSQQQQLIPSFMNSLLMKAKVEVYDDRYKDAFPSPAPTVPAPAATRTGK